MPKLKTNKAVRKRFKITARKKVFAARTKRRHLMTDRSPSKKRRFRRMSRLTGINRLAVLKALPYGS